MSPLLIFIGFAALVGVLVYFGYLAEKKRREALQLVAAKFGFSFSHEKDHGFARRFDFLNHLDDGSNRYAYNIMSGEVDGRSAHIFDYHYETYSRDSKGRRQTNHHYFSIFTLQLPCDFPELVVKPEGFFSKVGAVLGFDDIDFESVEFSKRYDVRSSDKKFAYDFCNAQMIDYLLRQQKLIIEVEANVLSLTFKGRLKPELIRSRYEQLLQIRSLMPNYLFNH